MNSMTRMTRRRLVAMSAAAVAAAAAHPFPKVIPAAAQESTPVNGPEPAESQVLRWLANPTPRLSVPSYGTDFTDLMLQNIYMTPFIQNHDGSFAPGICSARALSRIFASNSSPEMPVSKALMKRFCKRPASISRWLNPAGASVSPGRST